MKPWLLLATAVSAASAKIYVFKSPMCNTVSTPAPGSPALAALSFGVVDLAAGAN